MNGAIDIVDEVLNGKERGPLVHVDQAHHFALELRVWRLARIEGSRELDDVRVVVFVAIGVLFVKPRVSAWVRSEIRKVAASRATRVESPVEVSVVRATKETSEKIPIEVLFSNVEGINVGSALQVPKDPPAEIKIDGPLLDVGLAGSTEEVSGKKVAEGCGLDPPYIVGGIEIQDFDPFKGVLGRELNTVSLSGKVARIFAAVVDAHQVMDLAVANEGGREKHVALDRASFERVQIGPGHDDPVVDQAIVKGRLIIDLVEIAWARGAGRLGRKGGGLSRLR